MPDIVISNTSPLFYLHRIRYLDLLRKLYHKIWIPEAVVEELKLGKLQGEDVPDIANYDWIEIHPVKMPEILKLVTDLGPGESQVLALALENPDSLVIIDERLARDLAMSRNIKLTGTAGILLKAKQEGHISVIKPLLNALTQTNFRISETVIDTILKLANE